MPHALYTAAGAEVCLIVKDHKGEGHKEAKKRVKQAELARIAKVQVIRPHWTLMHGIAGDAADALQAGRRRDVTSASWVALLATTPRLALRSRQL